MTSQKDDPTAGRNVLLDRRSLVALAGSATLAGLLGTGPAGADSSLPRALVLDATGSPDPCEFSVEVSEELSTVETQASTVTSSTATAVEGSVTDGVFGIHFAGELTGLSVDGRADFLFGEDAGDAMPGGDEKEELPHDLEVRSTDGSIQSYAVTVEGTARTGPNTDTHEHEYQDRVVDDGDGTVTIEGWVRDRVDDYPFEGTVTDVEAAGPVAFRRDGADVSRSELLGDGGDGESGDGSDDGGDEPTESHHLEVSSADGSTQSYAVTVDGTAEPGSASNTHEHEYQDRVVDGGDGTVTIEGWVASASDDYEFQGSVTDVEAADVVEFALDGTAVTRSELLGEEAQEPDDGGATGTNIGGGEGYGNTVPPDAATTTVSTRSGLSSALANASAGDVVYLAGDADVDAGTETFTVPAGVTLASDRGIDGARGGRIYTTDLHDDHYGMVRAGRDARVTGIRVEGPIDPSGWTAHSYDYELTGIYATDPGVEVDNVEAYGWGYACVYTHDDTHVHHSSIHHANVEGIGYGVMANASENPIIEYNEFSHNRHSVATSGGGGFTARYNHVAGPAISHVFDQHRPGGTTTKIYNNTVTVVDNEHKNKQVPAVAIRGVPDDTADVYNNWFHNPTPPRDDPDDWTDEAIIQVHTDDWRNVDYWGNHYGSDEPSSDVGCPR